MVAIVPFSLLVRHFRHLSWLICARYLFAWHVVFCLQVKQPSVCLAPLPCSILGGIRPFSNLFNSFYGSEARVAQGVSSHFSCCPLLALKNEAASKTKRKNARSSGGPFQFRNNKPTRVTGNLQKVSSRENRVLPAAISRKSRLHPGSCCEPPGARGFRGEGGEPSNAPWISPCSAGSLGAPRGPCLRSGSRSYHSGNPW